MIWGEFWSGVVFVLSSCWGAAMTILPTVGDVCLFAISIYTFRLTVFPKKLKFIGFTRHLDVFSGDWLSITLENRSLCPVVIESVDIVLKSNCINVFNKKDHGERIIDGFKIATIKMEPYSSIVTESGPFKMDTSAYKDMFLIVKTSRNIQRIRYERTSELRQRMNHKLRENLVPAMVYRNTYNGKIVVPRTRYALSFADGKRDTQTIFIHDSGAMSSELFGYNRLSQELVEDEDALRAHFEAEFSARNMTCYIERVNNLFESTTEEEVKQ